MVGLSIRILRIFLLGLAFALQKNPSKLVFQSGHFAPKSFAWILYRTIIGVEIWERDLCGSHFFCEVVK